MQLHAMRPNNVAYAKLYVDVDRMHAVDRSKQRLIPARHHHHHHLDRCPAGFIYSPATSTCYLLRAEQVT